MNSLSIILLFAGIPLLIAAIIWKRYPPASPNPLYGYRTRRSMINDDTWREANSYSAKLLLKISLVILLVGLMSLPLRVTDRIGVVSGLGLVIIALAFLIYKTEQHLSGTFDEEGIRRE